MSDKAQLHTLELTADRALFSGEIQGIAVLFYRNERPLSGLSGLLDWRFDGALSEFLRAGSLTGELGQCAYVPLSRHGQTFHLILVGGGISSTFGERSKVPDEAFVVLQRNLKNLKLSKIGLSRQDFANGSDESISNHLKGCEIWIVN